MKAQAQNAFGLARFAAALSENRLNGSVRTLVASQTQEATGTRH